MKKTAILAAFLALTMTACAAKNDTSNNISDSVQSAQNIQSEQSAKPTYSEASSVTVTENAKLTELEKGLSHSSFSGDYKFTQFLDEGGAENDNEVIAFLSKNLIGSDLSGFGVGNFGCSAFTAKGENGYYFGRNFDWYNCNALVVEAYPTSGYASICTVNLDFIGSFANTLDDNALTLAAI